MSDSSPAVMPKGEASSVPSWASKHLLDSTNNNHSRCVFKVFLTSYTFCAYLLIVRQHNVSGKTRRAQRWHLHHSHTPRRSRRQQVTILRPRRPRLQRPQRGRRRPLTWRPRPQPLSGAATEVTGSAAQSGPGQERSAKWDSVWGAGRS